MSLRAVLAHDTTRSKPTLHWKKNSSRDVNDAVNPLQLLLTRSRAFPHSRVGRGTIPRETAAHPFRAGYDNGKTSIKKPDNTLRLPPDTDSSSKALQVHLESNHDPSKIRRRAQRGWDLERILGACERTNTFGRERGLRDNDWHQLTTMPPIIEGRPLGGRGDAGACWHEADGRRRLLKAAPHRSPIM